MKQVVSSLGSRARRLLSAHTFGRVWLVAMAALMLLTMAPAFAQSASPTVASNAPSYAAGERVFISGSGFAPNELVTLQVIHSDGTAEADGGHDPWTVTADGAGAFTTTWFVTSYDPVSDAFLLSADGMTSGRGASTTFTHETGSPPSLKTDQTDYTPGQTAIIWGSDFWPNETVTLQVFHTDPGTGWGAGHDPWNVLADADGNFMSNWYVNPDDSLGRNFLLTADGVTSGLQAEMTFADAAGPLTITLGSQETLWLDANNCSADGPRAAWLSFIVKNTGTDPVNNVTVSFAGFTGTPGGLVQPSYFTAPADLTRTFSMIGPGAQEPVYFYVDYSEVCNHPLGGGNPYTGYTANYTLTVTSTNGGTATRNSKVTTGDLLSASAAGLALSTSLGPGVYVGQLLTQTVAYQFGNNSDLFFQPAGDAGFDAQCIRLVGSEITAVSGTVSPSLIGLKDQLWFPTASVSGGGGNIYLTYTWQILCINQPQTLHPWAAAKSGQKYKYSGFQFSTVFPAAQPALTASKSVDPESILTTPPTGVVTWTVTFSNPTLVPLRVSKITDVIPACMSINDPDAPGSQVTAANSSSIPAVNATGTVNWVGLDLGDSPSSTYQVPAGGTLVLKYTTNVSGCSFPASYTNSATGTVGATTVGPVHATLIIGSLPSIALVKSANPTTYSAVGQPITYTYTITNTGNVTLAGPFTVTDDKQGTFTCGSGPLAPHASTTCTSTHTITQADLDTGSITNTATASTTYNNQAVTSNQSTATVTAAQTKALAVTKSASPTTYSAVGQTITYTYTITNTGNVTLADPFTVTDNKQGTFTCGSGPLLPGQSTSCTSTHTITQADLDAGSIVNTAIASGSGVSSNQASATVTATQTPHLSLTKTTPATSLGAVGNVITYTLIATNDGNVTLTNVSISDPLLGPLSCTPSQPTTLAPGGTLTCTGSHTVTQEDINAGSFNNTATATGTDPTNTTVTATASAAVPPFALTLAKTVNPMTYSVVGQVITYTYTITNTGGPSLAGPFSVTDDKLGTLVDCASGPLASGASTTCTATHIVTQGDIDAGSLTNTATASGNGVNSNQASATTNATQDKALTLAKSASPTTYSAVGDVITYTYTLTNIGSVTLSGPFSVSDTKLGTVPSCGSGPLAPNATTNCTVTYTITQADLDAGSVLNAATATAYFNNQPVTSNQATAIVTATQAAHLSLTKTGSPLTFGQVGQVITYTLIATNDGDVTLTNVSINDPLLGTLSCIPTQPTTLAPGATLTCTGIHTITAEDLTAGYVINTASATGMDPTNTPIVATASASIPPLGLTLAKTADPMTYDHVGQVITYTYTITNTGAVTLSGPFAVTDDKLGTISPCGINSLNPGQSTSCTTTYTITQADLDGNYVVNTATASGGGVTTVPSTAVVSATQAPHLSLTKTGNPAIFTAAGQVITYTLVATNDGNVTLTNVTISDPLLGTLSCTPTQPAILAPGGTLTCIGTYTTTQADLIAGYKINTATATGTDPTNTPVVATASASVPPLALTLTKTADPMTYGLVGQVITYTYTITNTGAVTLDGPFSVTDNKLGTLANCAIGPLAVGASTPCTAQYTITQADLDAGSITNSATASGNGVTTIPSTAVVSAMQMPELTLAKTANPMTFSQNGDVITYTYTITNTGNMTLGPAQFTVSDDHIGSPLGTPFNCGSASTTLAPTETVSCTKSYTATNDDRQAGSITNTATAAGGGVASNQATVTVTMTPAPVLTLAKSGVLDMTVVAPANQADIGDRINYTLKATNFGNVTLTNVSITDPLLGTLSCTPSQPATLDPGAALTCTGTYTLTQNDFIAGKVDNAATATGNYGNQPVPSNQASTTVTIPVAPRLGLTKSASPTTYNAVNQTITYTYTLTNTGNVVLPGPFSVSDNKINGGNPFPCGSGPLVVGASTACTATHLVTQLELDAGSIVNTATASTNGVTSNQATATVTAVQTPALSLTKSANPTSYSTVGQIITYTYIVKNTGNVTLDGPFSVTDDKQGEFTCGSGPLAPNGTNSCTSTHTITLADLNAGWITNIATASTTYNNQPVTSNQATATVTTPPTCKEDSSRAALLTRTVNTSRQVGGGGVPGFPANYWTVQEAYNAAKASPSTKAEVIGLYSKTTENVVLDNYSAKSMTLTQCTSAQVTAADPALPVWDLTANRKLLIIGPDAVGGTIGWELVTGGHELKSIRSNNASVAGVRILSNSNKVSWNAIAGNPIGLDVLGKTNTLQGSTIGPNAGPGVHFGPAASGNTLSGATIQYNTGNGVWIEGSTNKVQSNKVLYNSPNGFLVSGSANSILSNTIDSNSGDGVNVTGINNLFQGNKLSKNTGDGFDISGTGTKLSSNASNNGSSGSSSENLGYEYRLTVGAVNQGSNKADGIGIPKTTAPQKCPTFPAAGVCE